MRTARNHISTSHAGRKAFSLPELLVVMGIIALLIAILLPPLQAVHGQATATKCAAQLQQMGYSLHNAQTEYGYYPLWDDAAGPVRFTWVDVLLQRGLLANSHAAYCPEDPGPGPINAARGHAYGLLYPGGDGVNGMDYSYGIGVPLASGGWNWRPGFGDGNRRRFEGHELHTAQRVLAGDANWSKIYNLSGDAYAGTDWSYPTQFDNMIDWRHGDYRANFLLQDGHVVRIRYAVHEEEPINTAQYFLWRPGELLHAGPEDAHDDNFYPDTPPVDLATGAGGSGFPSEVVPGYYTHNLLWTRILHK
jgi:prepilin-type N-terminal cleavage/methylation domain-containing protein/prepilin-type processing-associated H-X9-DG protein